MILLDTHAFIWLVSSPDKLSEKARTAIAKNSSSLHLSIVSAWEISLLCRKNRLCLPLSPEQFVEEAVEHLHLIEIPLTRKTVQHSVKLPPIHNDPFDRVLIAECQLNNLSLISADKFICEYPDVDVIW